MKQLAIMAAAIIGLGTSSALATQISCTISSFTYSENGESVTLTGEELKKFSGVPSNCLTGNVTYGNGLWTPQTGSKSCNEKFGLGGQNFSTSPTKYRERSGKLHLKQKYKIEDNIGTIRFSGKGTYDTRTKVYQHSLVGKASGEKVKISTVMHCK